MMFQPLFLMDLLAGLGLGEQVMVAATFIITVLYLFKGKQAAGSFVGLMGTVWLATVSVLVAASVAIFLGWVNPIPEAFFSDLWKGAQMAFDFIKGPVDDWVRRLLSRLFG